VGTVPGVEACTGSLGQGLSVAQGMALAARLDGKDYRVFCLMGDGEIQEGQIWEAAMSAAKYKVDNLIGIVDCNKGQLDGMVDEIMPIEPVEDKWRAFGWLTRRIDGHDYAQILDAYAWACQREGQPKVIVADTIKGKGVVNNEVSAILMGELEDAGVPTHFLERRGRRDVHPLVAHELRQLQPARRGDQASADRLAPDLAAERVSAPDRVQVTCT
jgi:transketolase